MYVDNTRSWFMHRGKHSCRTDGGIGPTSVVGVLLDLRGTGTLSFYINGEPHGQVAFRDLCGIQVVGGGGDVFYPAVSINRNIQLTLQSGLAVPCEYDLSSNAG